MSPRKADRNAAPPAGAPPVIGAEAFEDDARESHELSPAENADLCAGCIKCCTYITVEIDSPRAAEEYDQWIWALYHEHISIFVEKPEKWFLQVDTRCGKLNTQGRCSIYGSHPVLCRVYDARTCERRLPLSDIVYFFTEGEQMEAWLREKRPAHYRNLLKFRAEHPVGSGSADPHMASGGLVTIDPPAPRRASANGRRGRDAAVSGRNGTRAAANGARTRTRGTRRS